jgi:glutamate formiminotransferase
MNCVPNISEGRNQETIEAIRAAILAADGVRLINVTPDADHNRTVYSFLGAPEAVLTAAKALAAEAIQRIDMRVQEGAHPRIGAVDVTPFIPVSGVTDEETLAVCRAFGRWAGDRGIPVYYYEDAATKPERVNLADVRKGQYEGLEARLRDPEWAPDEGPAVFVPRSGAFVVGARFPLIAFNVNLRTADVELAKRIAQSVRHISGGFRYVKAMGLAVEGDLTQVSMNLTHYSKTPVHRVVEVIRSEAARYGVAVAGTELVGAIPAAAAEEIIRFYLQCHDFSASQILELNCLPD